MSLRQWIVRKLMRPEDGYVQTNNCDFYVSDDDTYLVGYHDEHYTHFYALTLTGWREFDGDEYPERVKFTQWTVGIVNNIYNEYNARIEKLTRKDFNFKKKNGDEKLVITKQSFCEIVNALDVYWQNLHKIEGVLNVIFEDNALTQVLDSVVEALEEEMEPNLTLDEEPMIYDWLFNMDAGRDPEAVEGWDGFPLTTAEELYDYLVWKRDGVQDAEEV